MASFNAILDLSHMAEDSFLEAIDRYEGVMIASHSNPRRFRNSDRHLSDEMIRRLAERDVRFTKGPVDDLDHASQLPAFGSKMGIDATRKWPEEGFTRPWPAMIEMDVAVKEKVDRIWDRLGIER